MSKLSVIEEAFPFQSQLSVITPEVKAQVLTLYTEDRTQRSQSDWLRSQLYRRIFFVISESIEDLSQLTIPFPAGIRM